MRNIFKIFLLALFAQFIAVRIIAQDIVITIDTTRTPNKTNPVQKHIKTIKPKPPKQVSSEFSLGFRLNSNGWSLYSDKGKSDVIDGKHAERFYNVKMWQFEITEKKSPREMKSNSGAMSSSGSSSTYIFGKINNLYVLKIGYGLRTMIAGKPENQGSVSIHWVNVGGLGIGILKPYYLNISGLPVPIKYSYNPNDFLNQDMIMGNAGFGKGLSESQIIPGIHYKSAFHFDFAGNLKTIIAVETGVNAEYYFQDVQIMANNKSDNYFIDVFLSFQFGKRW